MSSSVLTRKGRSQGMTSPSKVWSCWEKVELSWQHTQGWVLRPCSDVIAEGAGASNPTGLQAPRLPICQGTGGCGRELVPQKVSQADSCCHEEAEVGMGESQGLGLASGWPWWGFWRPAGHSPPPVTWASSSPTCLRLDKLEGHEKAGIHLWPHSPLADHHHSADYWMEPLTVANRQLLTWGRSPLPCWPMVEQDH